MTPEHQPGSPEAEVVADDAATPAEVVDGELVEKEAPEADVADDPAGEVEADIAAEMDQADKYLALAQRTQADFENFRKRAARDAAAAEARGLAKLVRELLPALDHLALALANAPEGGDDFSRGVALVQDELHAALAKHGVEAYSPSGEPFDPQHHEAITQQPAPEGVAPGTVTEVYQAGYRLDGAVLRPARVVVAQ